MTPVKVCSICNGAIVGFGNIAEPIRNGRCCDRCYWETVVPEARARASGFPADETKRRSVGGMVIESYGG
jgi:hypothetical protein